MFLRTHQLYIPILFNFPCLHTASRRERWTNELTDGSSLEITIRCASTRRAARVPFSSSNLSQSAAFGFTRASLGSAKHDIYARIVRDKRSRDHKTFVARLCRIVSVFNRRPDFSKLASFAAASVRYFARSRFSTRTKPFPNDLSNLSYGNRTRGVE